MSEDNPTYEVDITSLVFGGDGMGRLPDGRAVFVPFVLPGERVRVQPVEEKRGFVRASPIEVVSPSTERITPRCPHFGKCGGCQYQHIKYSQQLVVKQQLFAEQLIRIGGLVDPPVEPIHPSKNEWYYRNHVQFHLNSEGRLGYLSAGSHQVIPIQVCFLPEEPINETWPQLEFEPGVEIERLGLRVGSDDSVMLILESKEDGAPEFSSTLPVSAVFTSLQGEVVLAGDDAVEIEVLGKVFHISAGSFFQVNTSQAADMVSHLLERLTVSPSMTLIDVYCGVGLFSAFLAPRVRELIGVELSPLACEDFAVNLDEFDHVSLYQGAAEQVLPTLNIQPDVVIVDPPRAGLDRRVLDAILHQAPNQLVYVSCDPATFARDVKRLIAGGYRLVSATPFDLFPQTAHIESVNFFTREKAF